MLGAVVVLLALVWILWALGTFAIGRSSPDLGEPIVVPTAMTSSMMTTPAVQPALSPTSATEPLATTPPVATTSPTPSSVIEAVPVTKRPAPPAGDDDGEWDDDDDPFDDDTDDDSVDDDVDDD